MPRMTRTSRSGGSVSAADAWWRRARRDRLGPDRSPLCPRATRPRFTARSSRTTSVQRLCPALARPLLASCGAVHRRRSGSHARRRPWSSFASSRCAPAPSRPCRQIDIPYAATSDGRRGLSPQGELALARAPAASRSDHRGRVPGHRRDDRQRRVGSSRRDGRKCCAVDAVCGRPDPDALRRSLGAPQPRRPAQGSVPGCRWTWPRHGLDGRGRRAPSKVCSQSDT